MKIHIGKNIIAQIEVTDMKCLLLIILLVAILISAGCISGNQNTPPPPLITKENSPDPIIGIWILNVKNTTYTQTFSQEGSYIVGSPNGSILAKGIWSKIKTDQYYVMTSRNETLNFLFHPETDTLTDATTSTIIFYRVGKEPLISSPPTLPTTLSIALPIYPTHFSGSKPDTQGFNVAHGGGYFFTASYSGRDNFMVWVMDNNGDYEDGVFNAIGSYSGHSVIHLDPGKYYLKVLMAQGSWTIDVSPT